MADNFSPDKDFGQYGDGFSENKKQNEAFSTDKREGGHSFYNSAYPYSDEPSDGGYQKKPSGIKRLTAYFTDKKVLPLSVASISTAMAIILFEIFGDVFIIVIRAVPLLYSLFTENHTFYMLANMIYSFCGVGVSFFVAYLLLKKANGPYLPFGRPRKNSSSGLLILAGLGICYIGNVAVSYMMSFFSSIGFGSAAYEATVSQPEPLPENAFQIICSVMYMAVFPAIFEEFAFRGVIMQPLRKYGDWFAIIVSSVMFGLVHGNISQVPFALIAGVALGYSAIVTGSLWIGIIIHFLNNLLSLVYSWAGMVLSDGAYMIFSSVFIYGIIVIGLVALAGYAYKNPAMLRLYARNEDKVPVKRLTAVYFLMPAMLVVFVILLKNMLADIVVR